jgi:hypothetical protein
MTILNRSWKRRPSCGRRDDSKSDVPFVEWMLSTNQWSPTGRGIPNVYERIEKIKEYVRQFGYIPAADGRAIDQRS